MRLAIAPASDRARLMHDFSIATNPIGFFATKEQIDHKVISLGSS